MSIPNPYTWKNYKLLIIIPLVLIAISVFFFIPAIPQGIDLKGGLLLTAYSSQPVDEQAVQAALAGYENAEIRSFDSPAGNGVEIELPVDEDLEQAEAKLKELHELAPELASAQVESSYASQPDANMSAAEKAAVQQRLLDLTKQVFEGAQFILDKTGSTVALSDDPHKAIAQAESAFDKAKSDYRSNLLAAVQGSMAVESYSFKEIGSSLSKFFFTKTMEVLVYSFVLSAIVVLAIFRGLVPSFAVVFGAVADITITAGAMGLFGIPLGLASIAALLMLIGFSLDTDALLTVRVLKRTEEDRTWRAFDAFKTGAMMNAAVITSFGVLTLVAVWLQIPTYFQIGVVAVIGSVVDFVATWCFNAVIVLWDAERRGIR